MAMVDAEDNGQQLREELLTPDDEGQEDDISFWGELRELSVLSLPVAMSTLARLIILNTDTAFVGHLGKKALTAAAFAQTWNQFLSNIVFAPGYALNSLCSQAIGAGNKKLAGVWLQLAVVVTSLLCVPVLGCYILTEPVVDLMVNEEGVPQLAEDFNLVSILILWPMVMYMIIRQYFQAMQVVKPAMAVSVVTVGFNYLMNVVFVPEDGVMANAWPSFPFLGLKGSPFATFLSMMFQLTAFMCYTVLYQGYHKPYWGGWSWECLQAHRVSRFFKMVLPMAVGIVLENSGLQVISFSTGHIGEANIAAHAILGSLWGVLWSLYWGCGLALQVRVGSYLGEGNVRGARMVARISVVLVVIVCFLVGLFAYLARTQIAHMFTKDDDVVKVVEESMYALVLDYFFACMALCAVNLLEAMAANNILAVALSVGMWGIQVPCSLLFAYKVPFFEDIPVQGIWIGQTCGEVFKLIVLWGYIANLDWEEKCREAKHRSEVNQTEADDDELEQLLEAEDDECGNGEGVEPDCIMGEVAAEAQASSLLANSPSPFIGSRSPRFARGGA